MRWLITLIVALAPSAVFAHPLAPVALWIDDNGEQLQVQLKVARVMPIAASFAARLPAGCRSLGTDYQEETSFVVETQRVRCEALVGSQWGVEGLSHADVDAVVRVRFEDGRVVRALLDESDDVFVVPERTSWSELAVSFGRSGLEHLVGGLDHVLLVLGLVLLLGASRRVLIALTAFTLGHGLSMFAAVLGWVVLPTAIAEAAIAATLVWLAWEVVRQRDTSIKRPYVAALTVGLIHGLGFAAVFSDAGLTGGDLLLGLGAFHLGIELGQVAIVLGGLVAMRLATKHRTKVEPLIGYGIGAVAYMWLIERVLMI